MKKFNFQAKLVPKKDSRKVSSIEMDNEKLIRKFLRKWKKSGILKELKEKQYPMTRGMKERKKRYLGKRRKTKV
jgi:ribosomal protein S21